jgi:hypothetical protein
MALCQWVGRAIGSYCRLLNWATKVRRDQAGTLRAWSRGVVMAGLYHGRDGMNRQVSVNFKNGSPCPLSTPRNLCVLCASALKEPAKHVNRRGAEDAEIAQRKFNLRSTTATLYPGGRCQTTVIFLVDL